MPITLVSSVVFKNNSFGIGCDNDLLYHIPEDLQRFKQLTLHKTVVMGYKTWESLPKKPLKDRVNIVLSNNHSTGAFTNTIFMDFKYFKRIYNPRNEYYVIGGAEIFSLFLTDFKPGKVILNHIKPNISKEIGTFFNPGLLNQYKLIGYSQEYKGHELTYRYLYYEYSNKLHQESNYLTIMENITKMGIIREDRTHIGTLSVFGQQCRFDIQHSIPLITTRKISFKNIVEELLWFCRGETNSKILERKGVNIWKANTSRNFLNKTGLNNYEEGEAGPIYGKQWRDYGKDGIDQLAYVENLLKNDPYSRRILLSSWNPEDLNKMCLSPCHTHAQWYVEIIDGKKYLSCQFYQRSQDTFLAMTYNVVSYSILTHILAKRCNMTPKEIVYVGGDCHIYKNHLTQVTEQLKRTPRPFPCLKLSDKVKDKKWDDLTYDDFELIGYFPDSSITAVMAV